MIDQGQFQSIWDKCDKPVLIYCKEDQEYRLIYRNGSAMRVCPDSAPELAVVQESLTVSLTGIEPPFCHIGEAASLLRQPRGQTYSSPYLRRNK